MDVANPGLSRRKRRAVAMAAGAAIVIIVAGVAYLRPSSSPSPAPVAPLAVNPANATPEYVTYEFTSPTVAWALALPGYRTLVSRTVDGGKHWQRRLTAERNRGGYGPASIRFFSEKRGFVATGDGLLRRTSDGGASWKSLSLPEPMYSYVGFRDERRGWLIAPIANLQPGSPSHLYATDDAGDSWQQLPDPPAGAYMFAFRGTSEAWLASIGAPRVYRSIDGGLTWQPRDISVDKVTTAAGPWNTQLILLPGEGVIALVWCNCNYPGASFTSFDGGATWRVVPPDPGRGPRFAAYPDDVNWWSIDGTILYRSSDAGQTWTKASDHLPNWQFQPRAVDVKHAWAQVGVVGDLGYMAYGLATTADAGLHWTRVTIPQST